MVKRTLAAFFDKLNKKYGNRGLEFDVMDNHYWIEIRINKQQAEAWRKSNFYDPSIYDTDEDEDLKRRKEIQA
jgi:hypothetical protein